MIAEEIPLEPLMPEDMNLLMGLAGPLYAESRLIEKMTSDNPVRDGYIDDGSSKIKRGLEQLHRSVQAPSFSPPPQYIHPPQVQQVVLPTPTHTPIAGIDDRIPGQGGSMFPKHEDPQLEFNFNITEQKRTNELLEKNNKLLQKMIALLESKKHEQPVKLNTPVKGFQAVPKQPV